MKKLPRGVLKLRPEFGPVDVGRAKPPDDLEGIIEHFWWVRWNVPAPLQQETLPYPSVHVVLEPRNSRVVGVMEGRFRRELRGAGQVFGIKFRPGAFHLVTNEPVTKLTNKQRPVRSVLGARAVIEDDVLAVPDAEGRVSVATEHLRAWNLKPVEELRLVQDMVAQMSADRSLVRVELVAKRFQVHVRTMQRLFSTWIGVSPKWVVQRARIQEAAEAVQDGKKIDFAQLALEMGYADQAHFTRDFRATLGVTPLQHARRSGARV